MAHSVTVRYLRQDTQQDPVIVLSPTHMLVNMIAYQGKPRGTLTR